MVLHLRLSPDGAIKALRAVGPIKNKYIYFFVMGIDLITITHACFEVYQHVKDLWTKKKKKKSTSVSCTYSGMCMSSKTKDLFA